ncbi:MULTISPECIES: AAA-like domain-containing protein [unclassified Microcoleus]|uniref:AAA-like domain-containing protein n=1 Tax=unclassified Microcoleus TaxID=2642155 RepID=UPI002FD6A795
MNVDEVLDTVEQSLLSRQLSSLERLILCQSWLGRGYSEMAADCAYSIAHIKDIGSQLWQAFSKTLGERVTKKNLFLVLKQYLLSQIGETVNSDQLPVTFSLVEVIESPLLPTTNQLSVATDFVEASYSRDSEQLSLVCDRNELVIEDDEWLFRVQQKYQTSTNNTEAKNNLKAPATQSEPTIPRGCLLLDSPLYINRPPIAELTYNEISESGRSSHIKAPRLPGKNSLLSRILNRVTHCGYKTVYLEFQEADVTVSAKLNQFWGWLCANLSRQWNLNPMLNEYREYG